MNESEPQRRFRSARTTILAAFFLVAIIANAFTWYSNHKARQKWQSKRARLSAVIREGEALIRENVEMTQIIRQHSRARKNLNQLASFDTPKLRSRLLQMSTEFSQTLILTLSDRPGLLRFLICVPDEGQHIDLRILAGARGDDKLLTDEFVSRPISPDKIHILELRMINRVTDAQALVVWDGKTILEERVISGKSSAAYTHELPHLPIFYDTGILTRKIHSRGATLSRQAVEDGAWLMLFQRQWTASDYVSHSWKQLKAYASLRSDHPVRVYKSQRKSFGDLLVLKETDNPMQLEIVGFKKSEDTTPRMRPLRQRRTQE